jgi:hypothetical protein
VILALVEQAAIIMRTALVAHGYVRTDWPLYRQFQATAICAGVMAGEIDGFPGTATMTALRAVLTRIKVSMPEIHVYSWVGLDYPCEEWSREPEPLEEESRLALDYILNSVQAREEIRVVALEHIARSMAVLERC